MWVLVATLASHFLDFQTRYGMAVVGKIPAGMRGSCSQVTCLSEISGLPVFVYPTAFGNVIENLVPDIIIIAVVSFAFTVSLGKNFGCKVHR